MKQNGFQGFLVLCLTVFILVMGAYAVSTSLDDVATENVAAVANHGGDQGDAQVDKEKPFLHVLFHDPIAFFTMLLAVFTTALAGFTWRLFQITKDGIAEQAGKTREALATAERSALAAERALEGADAPFISIIPEINATKQRMIGGKIVLQFMQGSRVIRYSMINYGNSPAFILEVYQGVLVSNRHPEPIQFPPPQTNIFKVQIVGPDKETPKYYIEDSETFTAGGDKMLSWADDNKISDPLWVSFQIRYRDALGAQFVSGHTFAFNSVLAEFYAQGGTRHNYRRKLTDDELAVMNFRDAL